MSTAFIIILILAILLIIFTLQNSSEMALEEDNGSLSFFKD